MMLLETAPILQSLIDWDTAMLLWLNGWHCDYFDNLIEMMTWKFTWIPFYVALAVFVYKHSTPKAALSFILFAVLLLAMNDQICSSLIRPMVGRLRPSNLDNPVSAMVHIVDGYRGGRFGFPSAHATNSWGLAFFVIYLFKHKILSMTMVIWALLVSYTRIYLGVHYVGDILAGLLLGLLNATIVYYLFKTIMRLRTEELRSVAMRESTPMLHLPSLVFMAEMLIMIALAFFVDPS